MWDDESSPRLGDEDVRTQTTDPGQRSMTDPEDEDPRSSARIRLSDLGERLQSENPAGESILQQEDEDPAAGDLILQQEKRLHSAAAGERILQQEIHFQQESESCSSRRGDPSPSSSRRLHSTAAEEDLDSGSSRGIEFHGSSRRPMFAAAAEEF